MKLATRSGLLPSLALVLLMTTAGACTQDGPGGGSGSGGQTATGGSGSGGNTGSGGTTASGGTTSTGGTTESGGSTGTGGGSGGTTTSGGSTSSGGSSAGGTTATGGATRSGGATGSGGAATGGTRATGGAAGGTTSAGGTGGSSGGATGGGGTTGDAGGAGGDGPAAACGAEYFKDWPANRSPSEIGLKLATLFDSQAVDTTKHYKTACTWYGALSVTGLLKDPVLIKTLCSKFDQLKSDFVSSTTQKNHVDNSVFGIVPLEIYLQNGDTAVRDLGLAVADHQVTNIASQKRMAIDDMFMITGLQVQAYRAAPEGTQAEKDKKQKYLNLAADTMVEYLKMQDKDGCFFQKEGANAKWGRGNGWFASGMTEMMRALPSSHKHYQTIRTAYEKMMKGLLDYQIKSGTGAGIWYQVIESDDPRNWPETSGSAMFAYAMITGVKLCILDAATYGPAARAAWDTLTSSTYLGADGKLKEISDWCYWISTSASGSGLDYYITIRKSALDGSAQDGGKRVIGDGHGQAPMLWSAAALLR